MPKILILGAAETPTDETPVWIAEHGGEMVIEHLAKRCAPLNAQLIFAMQKSDVRRHHLDSIARLTSPDCVVVEIDGQTQGAACTALLCIDHIDPNDELIVMNANELIDADLSRIASDFRDQGLDAGVTTFTSLHPRYSYVRLDDAGRVVQATEKHPISRSAIAGFFWFCRGSDFIDAAMDMIRKDAKADDHFFISLTLNELILQQKAIGVFPIAAADYQPLKSSRQVSLYETEA